MIGTVDLGAEVGNVVYDPGSAELLVAVQGRNEIAVVDPRTLSITERHRLQGCDHPHGLAVIDHRAVVACDGNSRLLVVDVAGAAVHGRFSVGDGPDVVAYDATLHRLYVMAESGVVAAFDVQADAISPLGRRKLAAGAHSAAVDPQTHAVYVPLASVMGQPVLRILSPT